jgi:hypothetical protein
MKDKRMAASIAEPKQRRQRKKVPHDAVVAMHKAGSTSGEIARELGFEHRSSVWRHLKVHDHKDIEFQSLKNNLENQFATSTLDNINQSKRIVRLIEQIPDKTLMETNLATLASLKRTMDIGAGINHDHFRLEAGLSTQNIVSIHADVAAMKALQSGGEPDDQG